MSAKRLLKNLPVRVTITLKEFQNIYEMLYIAIKYDGNQLLSTILLSAASSKQNQENKLASRAPPSKYFVISKKSASILNLERVASASTPISNFFVTPSSTKMKSKRLKTEIDVMSDFFKYQQSVV